MREKITAGKIWGLIYPVLLYTVITYVISFIVVLTLTVLVSEGGIISKSLETVISEAATKQAMMITMCSAIATLPFLLWFRYRDVQREKLNNRFRSYERVSVPKYLLIIPFALFGMLAANYFVSILTTLMPESMTKQYFEETATAIYESQFAVQVIAGGIICPIVEEMIFRGLIYNRLKKIASMTVAAVVSALLFGVFHGNWVQAPYAFIVGLLCVYVYERYKSMAAPILLHISANMFSILISYVMSDTSEAANSVTVSVPAQIGIYLVMTVITGILAWAVSLLMNKIVKPKEVHE